MRIVHSWIGSGAINKKTTCGLSKLSKNDFLTNYNGNYNVGATDVNCPKCIKILMKREKARLKR